MEIIIPLYSISHKKVIMIYLSFIEDEKTIFDKIIIDILTPENRDEFIDLKFKVIPIPEDVIEISSLFKITNIKFERVE